MTVPIFGTAPGGVACRQRLAAYAVIRNAEGHVAAVASEVTGELRYWLPGGGCEASETSEETVLRELREELGWSVRLTERIGSAVQFFFEGDRNGWCEMRADFFRAEVVEVVAAGQDQVCWLAASDSERFFHRCHAWAAFTSPKP